MKLDHCSRESCVQIIDALKTENERLKAERDEARMVAANGRLYVEQVEALRRNAERYRWLRINGLQRAWISLGTDCDGENFVQFKCEFKVPEPQKLPYEDDEGLEWSDKDFDAAIDAAIKGEE